MYLVWDRPSVDGAELRSRFLDDLAPRLLALGPHQLTMHLDDDEAPIPGPAPAPGHELPVRAAVSLFLDAHDHRAPYEEVLADVGVRRAGYLVSEARVVRVRRQRPTGPAGLARRRALTRHQHLLPGRTATRAFDERTFREFWHGHQSPMSEAVQPRWRYVRNTVVHPVTAGRPAGRRHRPRGAGRRSNWSRTPSRSTRATRRTSP